MSILLAANGLGHADWGWQDVLRVLCIVACFFLIGGNLAFIVHAPRIFPREARRAWYLFFTGKSMITLSVAATLWMRVKHGAPLMWPSFIAIAGVAISNLTLLLIWRAYARNERVIVERKDT